MNTELGISYTFQAPSAGPTDLKEFNYTRTLVKDGKKRSDKLPVWILGGRKEALELLNKWNNAASTLSSGVAQFIYFLESESL